MRAFDKKKNYRLDCKRMVRDGKMPNDQGVWVSQAGNAGNHIAAGHGAAKGKKR